MSVIDSTGHPARHGYSRCARCGTWRPAGGLRMVGDAPGVCVDVQWCDLQSGRSTGLDENGDAVAVRMPAPTPVEAVAAKAAVEPSKETA